MFDRSDLKPYQRKGIEFLKNDPFKAYWLDLGLGKTVTALTAFKDLLDGGNARRGLIVAPLRVAATTWPSEIANWRHLRRLDFTLIRPSNDDPDVLATRQRVRYAARVLGLPTNRVTSLVERAATRAEERARLRLLRRPTTLHIINREMVPWLVRRWGAGWPYDTVIWDESSGLRDHKTDRVRSMVRVRKLLSRLWELTGTPMPEGYMGLFPQIYLLDRGERFGNSITYYRDEYFTQKHVTDKVKKYVLKPDSAERIVEKIGDLALVMRAEDHLPVNKPIFIDRVVELDEDTLNAYKTLERDMVVSLPTVDLMVDHAGALHQKLWQFAGGAVYDEDRRIHHVHDHKIDALRELIEETQGKPLIVVYWHKASLARLKKAFPHGRQMDREAKLETPWNKGLVPLMFLHPQSGGHGLNLQYGGHLMAYFDVPFAWELYHQTVGRIARQGQKEVPRVFHLLAGGTMDEGIVPILQSKGDAQAWLFDRLQTLRRQHEESKRAQR